MPLRVVQVVGQGHRDRARHHRPKLFEGREDREMLARVEVFVPGRFHHRPDERLDRRGADPERQRLDRILHGDKPIGIGLGRRVDLN